MIDRSEMGQGVITGLAMLVAEELEVDLNQIRTAFAPAERVYFNPLIGEQLTGGSTSIRGSWEPLRRAGAEAREILIQAAANLWDVPARECRAEQGQVLHPPSNRRLGYGELINAARSVPVPENVPLKKIDEFKLIGHSTSRLDAPAMVLGRAVYGMDVELPGMLVASIAHSPVLGGRPRSYDASETYKLSGVKRVVKLATGVAVIADSTYAAFRGRAALKINWKSSRGAKLSTASIFQSFRQAARHKGSVQRRQGQALRILKKASRLVEAEYQTPYLAHAGMEPMNCTARIGPGRCDIWVGTQAQTGDQRRTARMAWMRKKQVKVHTQFLGGGFGRRGDGDFVREAVRLAREVDVPVQLVWTRQDDIQQDRYRPANYTLLKASLDKDGRPEAWFQRVVGPPLALDGINIVYAIPHIRIECVKQDPGVPTGAWRSVGASQNAFAVECFIDELADSAGIDPVDYRLALLNANSRHLKVLEIAADKAGWRCSNTSGRHSGVAFFHGFKSTVAQIAEVSVLTSGEIKVHRVVCVIDCGIAVNPDQVMAQMEGAIIFGLSAALKGQITIEQGQIQQANFEDYPILTLAETPEIEVHIVPSQEFPGGVGEPGVPPIAPAVANAVFAATGKRLRSLPLRMD